MRDSLCRKAIQTIALLQEKSANILSDEFLKRAIGAMIKDIWNRGKWIITLLNNSESIFLFLGMEADTTASFICPAC